MRAKQDFRKRVLKRSNSQCQLCGKNRGKLTIHHIEPLEYCKELKYEVNNAIVLCDTCHQLIHNKEYKNRVVYLLEHANFNKEDLPNAWVKCNSY